MIDLFFATSTNVYKIVIALEELALPYRIELIDISKGEQLDPARLAGSPTQKLPVIRDDDPSDGGEPRVVFESGAILLYLAEKGAKLLPVDPRARFDAIQWLFWQVGGLGPISGQAFHFHAFAPRISPEGDHGYAHSRYHNMMSALWRVLDRRLGEVPYLAGEDYSVADIACYPWIIYYDAQEGIAAYPNIVRWRDAVAARPAVRRAYERIAEVRTGYAFNEEKKVASYPWEGVVRNMITT